MNAISRTLLFAAACAVAGSALAQGPGYWQAPEGAPGYGRGMGYGGPGYGHGMGPGMMGGYPGYGMGPGMMQGYGPSGPGYGPQGYGPQRYGPGHGPGMGEGRGMMRDRWERVQRALGLSEDQRGKIATIREDTRRRNWDTLGQIQAERFKLREMIRGDNVDPGAVVEQQKKVDDLRRKVLHARLEARNQVFALLTPEQRQKIRSFGPPHRSRG